MSYRRLTLLLTLLVSTSGIQAQSQDDAAIAKQFVGMWRLASWTKLYEGDKSEQEPRSVSYLIYTDSDHMCWVAMDPDRTPWASPDEPTEAEELAAFRGLGTYCGTVEINVAEGYVVHHVEIGRQPNAVGTDRKRWFVFDGSDRLTLRVNADELVPPMIDNFLVWERVTDDHDFSLD